MDDGVDQVEEKLFDRAIDGEDFQAAKFILTSRRRDIYGTNVQIRIDEHRLAEEIAKRFGLPAETVLDEADELIRKNRS